MRVARLLLAVVLAGAVAGVGASLLTLLLHAVEHVAMGGPTESYRALAPWRRVATGTAVGVLAGLAWWAVRSRGRVLGLGEVRKEPARRMSLRHNMADAVTTVLAVGGGMAVGRETAPRQVAAAAADRVGRVLRLDDGDRVGLMVAAAAAGLAAVYNAPLAGAAYAAEVLAARWRSRALLLAVPACALATVVAWPVVGARPNLGTFDGPPASWWWGLPAGLLAAVLGSGYARLTAWARRGPSDAGWRLVARLGTVGLALGVATLWLPELTGNGRAAILAVLHAPPTVAVLVGLLLVKPLLTAGFLRAGAEGGVLAPALAAGACAGALLAHATGHPGLAGGVAVATAGATLSVSQRGAVFGPALAWEMTHADVTTTSALLVATAVAQVTTAGAARLSPARRRRPTASGS